MSCFQAGLLTSVAITSRTETSAVWVVEDLAQLLWEEQIRIQTSMSLRWSGQQFRIAVNYCTSYRLGLQEGAHYTCDCFLQSQCSSFSFIIMSVILRIQVPTHVFINHTRVISVKAVNLASVTLSHIFSRNQY